MGHALRVALGARGDLDTRATGMDERAGGAEGPRVGGRTLRLARLLGMDTPLPVLDFPDEAARWVPGLFDPDPRTLGSVVSTLPANRPDEIDSLVRLVENPASPYALPGAVALDRHDCIHVLLGRGLLGADEAFVVGYTMGAASSSIDGELLETFKLIAKRLYPRHYRMSEADLFVFDLGYQAGARSAVRIDSLPLEQQLDVPIGTLREQAGVDVATLRALYAAERALFPGSPASARLPGVGVVDSAA